MSPRLLFVVIFCLLLPGCNQARKLADKAKAVAAERAGEDEVAADPALAALVDQTPDGAVFRKDLPFPVRVEVRTTRELELENARLVQRSVLGTESTRISGTQTVVCRYERIGDHVRMTVEKASFALPEPKSEADDQTKRVPAGPKVPQSKSGSSLQPEVPASRLVGKTAVFRYVKGRWKPDPQSHLQAAAWVRELTPIFPKLLVDEGAEPRPYWFGSRRLQPGDQVPLTGKALAFLFDGATTGEVTLTLQAFKNDPNGHPCGVFAVTGSYSRPAAPHPDGTTRKAEVSIESGELWLSLIYPLVLREELEIIQSLASGGSGGPSSRLEGSMRYRTVRDWKVMPPAGPPRS